jgi:protein TonB
MRISAEGAVIEARLARSSGYPALDEAAVAYARSMRFHPARIGDTPVETTAIQPVDYRLP